MGYRILKIDSMLTPDESDIQLRVDNYRRKKGQLMNKGKTLADLAHGAPFFGLHRTPGGS